MSDTPQFSDDADDALTASPGEQLKREREVQGLSREEVAASLNLRPAVIRGLEEDQYDEVPVATYRRGYLRSYAHLLGIDDRPVLEAYRARHGSLESERRVTPVHVTKPPSRIGTWLFRLVTLLVVAGLVGLTLLWWQSRGGNEPPDVGENEPVAVERLDGSTATEGDEPLPGEGSIDIETVEEADTTVDDVDDATLPPLPEADDEMGLVAEPTQPGTDALATTAESPAANAETGTAEEDAVEAADTGAAEDEQAAEAQVLELTFREQSWTEIFDAGNQRVFVGLQEPGTTARVEGEPPFRLTVGNASGVELVWRGERVDLGERAGANNVARFTLGE